MEHSWYIKSNNFLINDYEIRGTDIANAIKNNLKRIIHNNVEKIKNYELLKISLVYKQDILDSKGGGELFIQILDTKKDKEISMFSWIYVSREEIQKYSKNLNIMIEEFA